VTLVGASKTFAPAVIKSAIDAGLRVVGENRVQEAAPKIAELRSTLPHEHIQWHLIGHLQSNKARRAVELFDMIQSVDSLKLAERLDAIAGELGRRLPILIEVNLGGESAKSGVVSEDALPLCERMENFAHLELRGLMAVPPRLGDSEEVRPFFRRLRELREQAKRAGIVGGQFKDLSMGMSDDFETAIEEGATFVRLGTALFGSRR
ncbi:MAG: YggS family pyridoxal phosphate-dependent enzyme, partial [Blastocatellia bacterium]|nr:YggS family pyridoxal phosphate-dependent enzyme [Blastocatellia bacterium]